jgi:hypothetical protein
LRRRRNLFGLVPPALVLSSLTTCAVFRAPPSFRSYLFHGTSSLELLLLFRVPFCLTCSSSADAERLPWGSLLLRDFSLKSPLSLAGSQTCLRSVLSVSRTLDGLLLFDLAAYFHPLPRPRFLYRGFPWQPVNWVSPVRTLLSLAPLGNASPSGFCSDYQSVAHACSVGSLQSARSPLEFMLPWVFAPNILKTSFRLLHS